MALLDASGRPISAETIARVRRAAAMNAYHGAGVDHPNLVGWRPYPYSGQAALTYDRAPLVARVQDAARNDGWASTIPTRLTDNIIGAGWRLSAKPNARALGIEPQAAFELAAEIEAHWVGYCNDPGFYVDVHRAGPMGDLQALAFRHFVTDGEAFAHVAWLPDDGGDYATAIEIIDPDRVCNPLGRMDTQTLRSGVEIDARGAAAAYHVRAAHQGDLVLGAARQLWERFERETSWGRPVMLHAFERLRTGQRRGQPPLAPILTRLRQIARYDDLEMQAATINALMAAFVESPFDPDDVASGLGEKAGGYNAGRMEHHSKFPVSLPEAAINVLYPGEKVTMPAAAHPNAVYESFVRAGLRNIASAGGISYEQLTMDWSQVNYSSARAALLEVARGYAGRKSKFGAQFMTPIYAAWLEEAIDMGRVRLPAGAPPFWAARAAYINADWIGPARGWVDPQKEAEAAGMRLSLGLSTLEREAADQGHDWMDLVNQRARERKVLIAAGLDPDPGRVEARIQPSEAQPLPPEQVAEQTGEAPEREPGDPDNVA